MASSFVCQKCKQSLQLDSSLSDLSPSNYDLLVSSLSPGPSHIPRSEKEKLDQLPAPASVKNTWKRAADASKSPAVQLLLTPGNNGKQPTRGSLSANESFVILQDSVVQKIPSSGSPARSTRTISTTSARIRDVNLGKTSKPPAGSQQTPTHDILQPSSPLSHRFRSSSKLFSLLSSHTDIDHPLCTECTESLLKSLNDQLKDTMRERDGYIAFEKELKKERERQRDEESPNEIEKRIERLKEEERLAIEDLRDAQREKEQLEAEMLALDLEEREMDEEESDFWLAHNMHLTTSAEQESQLASLRAAFIHDSMILEKLERTNVYNDAFCIGHDGVFGTINGLRLGRVSGVNVEWSEINAAWGQALLLLFTIARKLDITFETYRLVPMGSFSRIERTADKSSYELYGSGDLHLGRILHNRRFDFAMVAYLECLRQAIEYVRSQDSSVEFPHPIVKDKIGDVSIKMQFGVDEAWTRALRHVLLALKLLLKWTTSAAA